MANSGLYSVTVKPTITASLQHVAAFVNKELLFDWTEFYVPAGIGRIVGIAAFVRGTDGVKQREAFELYFSKSDDFSLGTINSGVGIQPNNDFIGAADIEKKHYFTALDTMAIANAKFSYSGVNLPSTKEPLGTGIKNTGRSVTYVAGVDVGVGTNFDFRTTCRINNVANYTACESTTIICDGSSALINFGPGDVLHATDGAGSNAVIGTVKSVSANLITLTDTNTAALSDDDYIYNISPIVLQLTFGDTASI